MDSEPLFADSLTYSVELANLGLRFTRSGSYCGIWPIRGSEVTRRHLLIQCASLVDYLPHSGTCFLSFQFALKNLKPKYSYPFVLPAKLGGR
jgi:hypothetical protein